MVLTQRGTFLWSFCSRSRARAVLSISREELKKLKECSLYHIGELLAKKCREFVSISFPLGISIPIPYWKEEMLMLYAHKRAERGEIFIEIFSLPKNTLIKLPLNNKSKVKYLDPGI